MCENVCVCVLGHLSDLCERENKNIGSRTVLFLLALSASLSLPPGPDFSGVATIL